MDVYTVLNLAVDNLEGLMSEKNILADIPYNGCAEFMGDMEWTMEALMNLIKKMCIRDRNMTADVTEDHVGAYAAQSAYFFMLCMIPIILLLITMVQYTPCLLYTSRCV